MGFLNDDMLNQLASLSNDITNTVEGVRNYDLAEWQYEKICEQIEEFQDGLDNEHEVALRLTNFGQSITLNVTGLGYQNPCLIYYYGMVGQNECQLIQHISQINFLLMAVKKADESRPPRRIGFGNPQE